MSWLTWSWIPGLHWLAWLHAGLLAKEPSYYVFGLLYAIPSLMLVVSRGLSVRLLLLSWGISFLHLFVQRRHIERRIVQVLGKTNRPAELMQALLQAALRHDGCLTVTQAVMETGATFSDIEQTLQEMVGSGYVYTYRCNGQYDCGLILVECRDVGGRQIRQEALG